MCKVNETYCSWNLNKCKGFASNRIFKNAVRIFFSYLALKSLSIKRTFLKVLDRCVARILYREILKVKFVPIEVKKLWLTFTLQKREIQTSHIFGPLFNRTKFLLNALRTAIFLREKKSINHVENLETRTPLRTVIKISCPSEFVHNDAHNFGRAAKTTPWSAKILRGPYSFST